MTDVLPTGTFTDYIPPNWDTLFMRIVYEYASKSKDPSSKIGALLVKDRRPILFGYNGFPEGVEDHKDRLFDRERKLMFTEHAERNLVDMAAKFGISSAGGTLYTQIMPCSGCAKAFILAGIREIVLHRPADTYFRKCLTGPNWHQEHIFSETMFQETHMKIRYVEGLIDSTGYFGGQTVKV